MNLNVLILDDKRGARRNLTRILDKLPETQLFEAASLVEGRAVLRTESIDLALIDIRLSDDVRNRDGLLLVKELAERGETTPVCVTASREMPVIREAIRAGARDYLLKDDIDPKSPELLLSTIDTARREKAMQSELRNLRVRIAGRGEMPGLVGTSEPMEALRKDILKLADSDRPVLVTGPTGAGKEAVVEALHSLSQRAGSRLSVLNAATLPEYLVESELFGHEKGAFTGADKAKPGHLSAVGEGTLCLDEIGELAPSLQAKLLRVLEGKTFRRVGGTLDHPFRGRFIAATHRDLGAMVQTGEFREDLFYRLTALTLRVPSLNEHREDIPALVEHFAKQSERPLRFSKAALEELMGWSWPGNVRQLRNLVDKLVVFAEMDEIGVKEVREIRERELSPPHSTLTELVHRSIELLDGHKPDALVDLLVMEAVRRSGGNKSEAGRLLGVNRRFIERKLNRMEDDPSSP